MRISIIVAMSENRVIGRGGQIPWHLPEDLGRFKKLTTGHTLIMGRKTHESIGHILPGRRTIILSRRPDYCSEGCDVAPNLRAAIEGVSHEEEVFVCGGSAVYAAALPYAHRIYLTLLHTVVGGDTFFPPIPQTFVEDSCERHQHGELTYDFCLLVRKTSHETA